LRRILSYKKLFLSPEARRVFKWVTNLLLPSSRIYQAHGHSHESDGDYNRPDRNLNDCRGERRSRGLHGADKAEKLKR